VERRSDVKAQIDNDDAGTIGKLIEKTKNLEPV